MSKFIMHQVNKGEDKKKESQPVVNRQSCQRVCVYKFYKCNKSLDAREVLRRKKVTQIMGKGWQFNVA